MIVVADPRYKREIYHDHDNNGWAVRGRGGGGGRGAEAEAEAEEEAAAAEAWSCRMRVGRCPMAQDSGLIVRDVTVRAVVVPLRRPLATRVGDFPRWPLLLIDVTTEQGITGRGYIGPYLDRAAAALVPAIRDLGEALRGRPEDAVARYRAGP